MGIVKIKSKPMVESILSLKDNIFVLSTVPVLKLPFSLSAKWTTTKKIQKRKKNKTKQTKTTLNFDKNTGLHVKKIKIEIFLSFPVRV